MSETVILKDLRHQTSPDAHLRKSPLETYRDFLSDKSFIHPVSMEYSRFLKQPKKRKQYLEKELTEFWNESRRKLVELKNSIPTMPPPLPELTAEDLVVNPEITETVEKKKARDFELSNDYGYFSDITIFSHGNTFTNQRGLLTGWSGDFLCHSYKIDGEDIVGGLELVEEQREKFLKEQKSRTSPFYIRFTGDLPRHVEHAIRMVNSSDSESIQRLNEIIKRANDELSKKGHIYSREIYIDLNNLALDNNFIPTPLLRAQNYGEMEGLPEKFVKKGESGDEENLEEHEIGKILRRDYDVSFERSHFIARAIVERKELLSHLTDYNSNHLSENRIQFLMRIGSFFDIVYPISRGRKSIIVTSSGVCEVIPSYFRCRESRKTLEHHNPPKLRGKPLKVVFGEYNNKEIYVNDPERLRQIREDSLNDAKKQRHSSPDPLIRDGIEGAIIPARFQTNSQKYTDKMIANANKRSAQGYGESIQKEDLIDCALTLDEMLDEHKELKDNPVISCFGLQTTGKSTCAIDIVERLNTIKTNFVVYANHEYISSGLKTLKDIPREQALPKIASLLSRGLTELPTVATEDYKVIFVIDGIDKLEPDDKAKVLDAVNDPLLLRQYGAVLCFDTGFCETTVKEGYKANISDFSKEEKRTFLKMRNIDSSNADSIVRKLEQRPFEKKSSLYYLTKLMNDKRYSALCENTSEESLALYSVMALLSEDTTNKELAIAKDILDARLYFLGKVSALSYIHSAQGENPIQYDELKKIFLNKSSLQKIIETNKRGEY